MKLPKTRLEEFSRRQIHSKKRFEKTAVLFWQVFKFHLFMGSSTQLLLVFCFLEVLLFFCLIKPTPRKVTTAVPALARKVEIVPQPYAFHTVFSRNQTSEMSALLAKNMRQIDQQDGRSMAAQYHHLAYSVL